jgi:hypothetical protein
MPTGTLKLRLKHAYDIGNRNGSIIVSSFAILFIPTLTYSLTVWDVAIRWI